MSSQTCSIWRSVWRAQRALRGGSIDTSDCGWRQAASAWLQRGSKRHPAGMAVSAGTRPGTEGSTDFRGLRRGIERSSPEV